MKFAFITTTSGASWGGGDEVWRQAAIQPEKSLPCRTPHFEALVWTCSGAQRSQARRAYMAIGTAPKRNVTHMIGYRYR